jgi:signal transduction histidine kinase
MQAGEAKTNAGGGKQRYFSLQTKLGFSFSILTIVISALLTFALYQSVRGRLREDIRRRLYDIVNISALQIDGDAHSTLVDPSQEGSTVYKDIKRSLQNIRDRGTDIRYVYTWRRNANGRLVFVVDAETDPEEISHLGDVYVSAEPSLLAELAALDHTMVDEEFTTDKWGIWLSGYAPFYRSDGQMEGILGIDIAASDVLSHERKFLWIALGVFAAIIPLASILGWLAGRRLSAPIAKLMLATEQIAGGDLNHRVDVQSNDEVGSLANSFNKMTEALQETITNRDQEIVNRKKAENTLKVLNEDLQSTVQQLSRANRELEDFAYITAHDLKAPLRGIGTLAEWIASDYADKFDEKGKKQIELLMQRSQRMYDQITSILSFSEIGRGAKEKERIDLNELVEKILEDIKPSENIKVTIADELPTLVCEKMRLTQIFQNLLSNAVKYIDKPNGRVTIGCTDKGDFWKFSVDDNGPGIEEKYFDKIFTIFQTLSAEDDHKGTGMGLAIVRKAVEIYGGRIWVESTIGQGATFFFTLPKLTVADKIDAKRKADITR